MIRAAIAWAGRHVIGLALASAVAGVGTAVFAVDRWLSDREAAAVSADRLQREIADLRAENDARAEAAEIARAHARRLALELVARGELIQQLRSMEALNEPLPDPLRDAAGLLWR